MAVSGQVGHCVPFQQSALWQLLTLVVSAATSLLKVEGFRWLIAESGAQRNVLKANNQ